MPDDIYARLREVAAAGGEVPDSDTFAAGARCLRRLYNGTINQPDTTSEDDAA